MDPEEHQDDALWRTLAEAPEVEVEPFFAKQVAREVRLQGRRSRLPVIGWFLASPVRWLPASAATAAAAAMLVILAMKDPQPAIPAVAAVPGVERTVEQGVAALEFIGYLDELVGTEDPNFLSDEDILALLLDDGSSALLF